MRKRFDYALFLIGRLKERDGAFVDINSVAEASGLPKAYLEKVAQELKRAGWIESKKGAGGGYRLLKDKKSVSVEELMRFYNPLEEFCPVLRTMKSKSLISKL